MGQKIYANIDATSLTAGSVQSATDLRPRAFKPIPIGDSFVVDLFLTGANGLENIQSYSSVRLAIGIINSRPTSGTFLIGSETLNYNATTANIDAAITAEVAACTVRQLAQQTFKITFDANGARSIPAVNSSGLSPSSTASIVRLQAGSASTKEIWLLRLFQNPLTSTSTWENISGQGIRGSLPMTTEGLFSLLGTAESASTVIELEITDSDGNIQTIFQNPIVIQGEVIGQSAGSVASYDTYATSTELANSQLRGSVLYVSDDYGDNSTASRNRPDKPYKTTASAIGAALSGDLIYINDGDFSAQTATATNGIFIQSSPNAIGPKIVITATAGCELIGKFYGVENDSETTVTIKNAFLNYIYHNDGFLVVDDVIIKATSNEPYEALELGDFDSIRLRNCRLETSRPGSPVVSVGPSSGNAYFTNTTIFGKVATATAPSDGIKITSSTTSTFHFNNVSIKGTSTGTYLAKSIQTDDVISVNVFGGMFSNVQASPTVSIVGGPETYNPNFDF